MLCIDAGCKASTMFRRHWITLHYVLMGCVQTLKRNAAMTTSNATNNVTINSSDRPRHIRRTYTLRGRNINAPPDTNAAEPLRIIGNISVSQDVGTTTQTNGDRPETQGAVTTITQTRSQGCDYPLAYDSDATKNSKTGTIYCHGQRRIESLAMGE